MSTINFIPIKVIRDKDIRREGSKYYTTPRILSQNDAVTDRQREIALKKTTPFIPKEKDLTIPQHNAIIRFKQKSYYFLLSLEEKVLFEVWASRYFRNQHALRFI